MTPEQWNRLFDLFHVARERSGGERVAVLDAACGEDATLRRAVEELLREDEAANGFLSQPLFSPASYAPPLSPVVAGQRIGRYILSALIGRGGMGAVWSAQDTDLDRLVAVKFLSSETLAGLDPQQITREAKAASALNHPGIVTIYEVIPFGHTPAMVMELVHGKPLREACGRPLPMTDGLTIGFHIAEFETAVRRGLPFVAILGNDGRWNAESEIQRREYGANRMHGCELLPARYDQVVQALGGHGEYVERAADLTAAIDRALGCGKPACVNVMIESTAAPALRMPL